MPFARYFRLSPFSPFSLPFSPALSYLSLSLSLVLRGTLGYRQETNAALSVVLLSVRTSANSSLRPTNRTSDCPPFSTRLPLVSRFRYPRVTDVPRGLLLPSFHGGRGSNGRPLVAVGLKARLFYVFTSTFLFLAWESKSEERKRERGKIVGSFKCVHMCVCLKFSAVSEQSSAN